MQNLSDHQNYSETWTEESLHFESFGIYELLAKLMPSGKVLEIGCGVGAGTLHLAQGRQVLSLDNNGTLISAAKSYLEGKVTEQQFHQCDLFSRSGHDCSVVQNFAPRTIAAWFIGGSGIDMYKHTEEEPDRKEKGKLYREKLEDIIISADILTESVDTINFVYRSGKDAEASKAEVCGAAKDDYDTHVFKKVGFKVTAVSILDWPMGGNNFPYAAAFNPNFVSRTSVPIIVSVVASRI